MSVLGKRSAEVDSGVSKRARVDSTDLHPCVDLTILSPENSGLYPVKASKAILVMHLDRFAGHFELYPDCTEYQFAGTVDEWNLFVHMLRVLYLMACGKGYININVLDIKETTLKMYEQYQLKPELLKAVLKSNIVTQIESLRESFYSTPEMSTFRTNLRMLSGEKTTALILDVLRLCRLLGLYKSWNSKDICQMITENINWIFNKISSYRDVKTIYSTMLTSAGKERSVVIEFIVERLLV